MSRTRARGHRHEMCASPFGSTESRNRTGPDRSWDDGKANELFQAYDRAVVLDALGNFDRLTEENPEKFLDISDWMRIHIESHPVSLNRFEKLLAACAA